MFESYCKWKEVHCYDYDLWQDIVFAGHDVCVCDAILPDISEVQDETYVNHRTKKNCCSVVAVLWEPAYFSRKNPAYYPFHEGRGGLLFNNPNLSNIGSLAKLFYDMLVHGRPRLYRSVCVCVCFFPGFPLFVWELSWTDIIKRRKKWKKHERNSDVAIKKEAAQMKKKDSALTPVVGRHKNGHFCFFFLGNRRTEGKAWTIYLNLFDVIWWYYVVQSIVLHKLWSYLFIVHCFTKIYTVYILFVSTYSLSDVSQTLPIWETVFIVSLFSEVRFLYGLFQFWNW